MPRPKVGFAACAFVVLALWSAPAHAVLDINDRGPVLDAGAFAMRVTNAGILGNAFYDKGLSFDPSLEFPRGSGHEALGHAELWVGAVRPDGTRRVSGGPMLEWRPHLDGDDASARVIGARAGAIGSLFRIDDDRDGRVDEETLNGRDDDGDGKVDEDYAMVSDQEQVAEYRDDELAATSYGYANGEPHAPMHLAVRQEAFAWAIPGYDHVAAYDFTITNEGTELLRDVRLGIYADLDSRGRDEAGGHLNDLLTWAPYDFVMPEGTSNVSTFIRECVSHFQGTVPVVYDRDPRSGLPASTILGLSHTTDPLGFVKNFAFPGAREAQAAARAPRRDTTFQYTIFAQDLPPGAGGPPIVDDDRFRALAGDYPQATPGSQHDWAVLLSCGPFQTLAPGQAVHFAIAFVVAPSPESLATYAIAARMAWRGTRLNLQPDAHSSSYLAGNTGINGHEVFYEPPPGIVFTYDPHCPEKFTNSPDYPGRICLACVSSESTYSAGHGVWTDFDCDACTGLDGAETHVPWQIGGLLPPKPTLKVMPGDASATLLWDNLPEVVLQVPGSWAPGYEFGGYRIYRLDRWNRKTVLPAPERWERIAAYRPSDLLFAGPPLTDVTDATVRPLSQLYGYTLFPPGRYRFVDTSPLDGFDYLYVVTTVFTKVTIVAGSPVLAELESPLTASFEDKTVPRSKARPTGAGAWVVPNPYYGHAPWERQPVPGDAFTRHIDFFGLPRARCTIKIYTLAGDLVRAIDHDGSAGAGEATWDLISRNGQDVESGVYLFTVDSKLGHQVGKFVLIR